MSFIPHNLFAMSGTLSTATADDEIWECTIRGVTGPGVSNQPLDETECDAYLAAVQSPLATWFSAANTKIPSTVKLKTLKMNPIGADGKYSGATTHRYDYSSPPAGNVSAGGIPSFCCAVYSWRTALTVGSKGKGRMYLPNAGINLQTGTATISSGDRSTAATQAAALISLLRITLGDGAKWLPCVVSSQGVLHEITSVLVGNVIDTQRRRKNRVKETYTANVFGPG